jgi:hypothetical protein
MIDAQKGKYVAAVSPAAILDNTSATATAIDCKGSRYAEIICIQGATDIAMTVLKLQECETSGGTYADITGATFNAGLDTDGTALALPSATDDNQIAVFQVNLDKRMRFIKVVATFGDGTVGGFISAVARLSELSKVPDVSTDLANGGVCRV